MPLTPQQAASILVGAGLSVIPIKIDGSKAPLVNWALFQTRLPSNAEITEIFAQPCGIAVIAGAVSGNLEIIDIEAAAPMGELASLIDEHLPGMLPTLPQVNTPTGGRHIFYRCDSIQGNQKLAISAKSKVLIETRGEGGYVVTVSSPPECHPLNKPYVLANSSLTRIPTIAVEQRDVLLSCCRSFNCLIRDTERPVAAVYDGRQGKRPGDDYNVRGDALDVLFKHGWKVSGKQNGSAYLTRPGKKSGISASFGRVAPNTMYVFSSNAKPFDFERAYDAFGVVTRLEYAGDFERATRELREQGFGEPLPKPPPAFPLEAPTCPPLPPIVPDLEASAPMYRQIPDSKKVPIEVLAETMDLTQDNCARLFEEEFNNEFQYCKTWHQWLEWRQSWSPELTDLPFDKVRLLLRRVNRQMNKTTATASFAAGVEKLARASRTFATTPDQWDSNDWFLNMPIGTLNLKTEEIHDHRREDYITKITKVSPSNGPKPIFDRFIRDITLEDESLAKYLQRSLGACLSGAIQDHWILVWIGEGRNGKNTLGDLVTWIMGDYATVIPTQTLMSQKHAPHLTEIANLRGLRLAVSSEVSEGSYWDEARVKLLTGEECLSARYMHRDLFTFRRTHKHLVYGNHRPMLRVVDGAMKARLHLVPFKARFVDETCDPLMPVKLRTEAPQVLQWLIDGHARWVEDGSLKKCSAVQAETDSYFEAQSTNETWLAECCIEGLDWSSSAKDLYGSFKGWKEARGEGVISQTRWGEWMNQRGYEKSLTHGRVIYRGIAVKQQSALDLQG